MVPWEMEVWFGTKVRMLLYIMCELLDS